MKTLADLKRELTPGRKLALVYRYKKLDAPIRKEVIAAQLSGVMLTTEGKDGRSRLSYPKASLLELTDKGFRIYAGGRRPLTEKEKEIRAGYEAQRDPEREKRDLMSDGSASYWAAVRYYREKDAEYLQGNKDQRGMRYDHASGLVLDDRIKGDLCLEYVFV